jgi:hypothetical protein
LEKYIKEKLKRLFTTNKIRASRLNQGTTISAEDSLQYLLPKKCPKGQTHFHILALITSLRQFSDHFILAQKLLSELLTVQDVENLERYLGNYDNLIHSTKNQIYIQK